MTRADGGIALRTPPRPRRGGVSSAYNWTDGMRNGGGAYRANPSLASVLGSRHASSPFESSSPGSQHAKTISVHLRKSIGGGGGISSFDDVRSNRGIIPKRRIVFDVAAPRPNSRPTTPTRSANTAAASTQDVITTPSRRSGSSVASAAQSPSRGGRGGILSTPLSSSRCHANRRPGGGGVHSSGICPSPSLKSSPSTSIGDRFIPNRSHMSIDLCRASVQSAEKRRMATMEKMAEQIRSGENGSPQASMRQAVTAASASAAAQAGEFTPLQVEFRRRMRGALFSVPLDALGHRGSIQGAASNNTESRSDASSNRENYVMDREDMQNLAYAALPDGVEDEERDAATAGGTSGTGSMGRMLSFRSSSILDETFASTQSNPDMTASVTGSSSSISSATTQRPTPSKIRRSCSVAATGNPFSHDQLHVLHRTASGSGRFLSSDASLDPLSMTDVGLRSVAQKVGRRISSNPSRILDAPELVDDYYLNLISWSKTNVLAVALGQCLYLWNASSGSINHLLTLEGQEDYVTSVSWATRDGNHDYIAVGTNDSAVQLWDTEAGKKIRTLGGHTSRVGSLAWNHNFLSTGGRDSLILQHDVRSPNHITSTYTGHTQEVCGLKWNDDGTTLASGGNENYLCLWDASMSQSESNHSRRNGLRNNASNITPRVLLTQHQAAVKALAWCPFHRGLLASGGGTADRTIKFWNTNSGAMLNSIDTGSQVCSLLWSKHQREICSSHGFSENQLILWRYPTMTKIQEFKGHTARVLHMAQSPDGSSVVSAAADETLRFWDIFGEPPSKSKGLSDTFSMGGLTSRMSTIR